MNRPTFHTLTRWLTPWRTIRRLEDELNAANKLLGAFWRDAERTELSRIRLCYCPTHGQQPPNAWGCPECVRELRGELATAREALRRLSQWAGRPFANALLVAESALADVAEGEVGRLCSATEKVTWAELRCTEALATIRPVMRRHGIRTSEFPPAAPAPAPARAGSADSPIPMVLIPSGSFLMGSPEDEPRRSSAEGPQHQVTLGSFFMAQTPTTQAQWREVAGWPRVERDVDPDPSHFKGDNRPVENVSWLDAMEFCHRLSQRTGNKYTLPSEAQWEYACRAGTTTPFHFGPTISTDVANYDGNYIYGQGSKGINREQTTDVASFHANTWGLHDMHGNVWEWCLDEWHDSYKGAPVDGSAWEDHILGESTTACCAAGRGTTSPRTAAWPTAPTATRSSASTSSVSASVASNANRLLRGGSWISAPANCRSAYRLLSHPGLRFLSIGFRVCCLPQD